MTRPDRFHASFTRARDARRGNLLPYVTSGYPDLNTSSEIIARAAALGATVIEVGIPYSDSIADGPVIQQSFHAALERGLRLRDTFEMIARIRPRVECALAAMVSYSLVHRAGRDAFLREAAEAGFDGVILPDLPLEESAEAIAAAESAGLRYIGLVAPTSSPERRERIAKSSTGFVYQIAVAGTTGERGALPVTLKDDVASLRRSTTLPVCVGFGIATAEQVRQVCDVADGAIVGSAIVRRVTDSVQRGDSPSRVVESTAAFIGELMRGTS